ncbi:signal peptide peptidase SppA [Bradyrhizobium diazoefficiens]|uniref:S49 family peptidase n=1 Tax=Bradyrhizobium diazoefficiens TaxID=1355477 RepID=UPI00351652CC
MTLLARIAERVLNRPLLIHPDKLPLIMEVLEGRIPVGDVSELHRQAEANVDRMPDAAQAIMRGPHPGASRFVGSAYDADRRPLPYRRTDDGIAVITVTGSLVNRGAWVGSNSGETSYEGIKYQVMAAVDDPRTRAILMDIESPGGEAVGALEAAAIIEVASKLKPVIALVNGMAASAAYALAAGAGKIITTPTGMAGSIGVVMLHVDYSRMLDREGIKPTLIFAGAHKVDGNPFEPLTDTVHQDLKAEVDAIYDLFVKSVAAGRKGLSPAAIRATEARTFMGQTAIDRGLADEMGTFETVLRDMVTTLKLTSKTTSGPARPAVAARRTISEERAAQLDRKNRWH